MTSGKRTRATRAARTPAPAMEDTVRIGRLQDDGDQVADVEVHRGSDGRAYFVPRSLRDVSPPVERCVAALQGTVRALAMGQEQLERNVAAARAEGMSWESIGWCIGLTGEAVRKRFAD